jgi:NADPH:quinone reductase-like Zn-dependent oxidoreductase
MKRVVVRRPGGVNRLVLEECDSVLPGAGEVSVKVRAAGVNFADLVVRLGQYRAAREYVGFPITPGFEVSGTVTRVGDDVRGFHTGDEVIGLTRFGGYTTEICLPESQVMRLPRGLDLVSAAGFSVVFLTAWYGLIELAHPRAGTSVLVHSAAGGVGTALVQLAKRRGCRVVGVVGSPTKVAYVRDNGADVVIDRTSEPLWPAAERASPDGYQAVLDASGGKTLRESYRHVRPGGHLVVYGAHTLLRPGHDRVSWLHAALGWLRTPRFDPMAMIDRNVSVHAFNLSMMFHEAALLREGLTELFQALEKGEIRPAPVTRVPFDDVREAHRLLHSGKATGKVVLVT